MNSYIKRFGIIAFVTVIGFLSVACRDDSLDRSGWNATYQGAKVFLRFNSPHFTMSTGTGEIFAEGTYSVSDSVISMAVVTIDLTLTGTLNRNTLLVTAGEETIRFTRLHRIFGGGI